MVITGPTRNRLKAGRFSVGSNPTLSANDVFYLIVFSSDCLRVKCYNTPVFRKQFFILIGDLKWQISTKN